MTIERYFSIRNIGLILVHLIRLGGTITKVTGGKGGFNREREKTGEGVNELKNAIGRTQIFHK